MKYQLFHLDPLHKLFHRFRRRVLWIFQWDCFDGDPGLGIFDSSPFLYHIT